MKLKNALFFFALLLGASLGAFADASRVDVTQPQKVFKSAVLSTPTNTCNPLSGPLACSASGLVPATPCSILTGAVANRAFWGGNVTVYVVCPAGAPVGSGSAVTTTTVLGVAASSCTDGTFSVEASNACAGQTGCYALIAAAPPTSCETCGTCGAAPVSDPSTGDPGWNSCTNGPCPSP